MIENFRVLYVGHDAGTANSPAMEHRSRAITTAGGELACFTENTTGELIEAVKEVDSIMVAGHQFPSEIFAHMGNNGRCKGAVFFGHGFDKLDVDAATGNGVILANTASFGTEEVSNHAIMLFLVCSRKFVLHDKLVRSGVWTRENLSPMGHIAGQTFGIVGMGDIGRAVARKAKAFGCHVIGYDPYLSSWDAIEYNVEMVGGLDELARRSDYISIHTFLNPSTHHMINDRFIESMKPTAYLINCSRGPVVDENALIKALQTEKIAGAGLDVFEQEPISADNPLLKMDNVAVTNHYASYSEHAWERANTQMGEEAVRIAMGYWPMSLINRNVIQAVGKRKAALSWDVLKTQLGKTK